MYLNTGIIGHPLDHTLSPMLHNYFMYHFHVNGGYCCFDVSEKKSLGFLLNSLKKWHFNGLNVTLPYKTDIIPLLDFVDENALNIGAVNTIVIENNGCMSGYNTDFYGICKSFEINCIDCDRKDILVIGAGGAAKALLYYLKNFKYNSLTIVNRSVDKAEVLASKFNLENVIIENLDFLQKENEYDIIINTTSLGINDGNFLDMSKIGGKEFVFDLQYSKMETPFLKQYKNRIDCYADGLVMLIYQGYESFLKWVATYDNNSNDALFKGVNYCENNFNLEFLLKRLRSKI